MLNMKSALFKLYRHLVSSQSACALTVEKNTFSPTCCDFQDFAIQMSQGTFSN